MLLICPRARSIALSSQLVVLLAVFATAVPVHAEQAPDPSTFGPWRVGNRSFNVDDESRDGRRLATQIWYPIDATEPVGEPADYQLIPGVFLGSTYAEQRGTVAEGPFPLIVFSHGSGSVNVQSVRFTETLASHGFIVVAPNHAGNTVNDNNTDPNSATNRPLDVSVVIDSMTEKNATPSNRYYQRIDLERIGVAGHSFGGFTAVAMAAGIDEVLPDARVDAIFPIAAVTTPFSDEQLSSIGIPAFLLGGTLDDVVPVDPNHTRAFALISAESRYRAEILGAAHTHFANICSIAQVLIDFGVTPDQWPGSPLYGPLLGPYEEACIPGVFPIDEAQRIQSLYGVAFFRRVLLDDERYDPFLSEGYASTNELDVAFLPEPSASLGTALVLLVIRQLRRTRAS